MKRREFIQTAGMGIAGLAAKDLTDLFDSEYPFPYDSDYFEAAERIVFLSPTQPSLNIIPKEGKSLDIRLCIIRDKFRITSGSASTITSYGVRDSAEVLLPRINEPSLEYWIEYRESGESSWKSTPRRTVKTPCKSLSEKIEVILIGDDHLSDDADPESGEWRLQDPDLRRLRLNGDAINEFLRKLNKNPNYTPRGEWGYLMNAFCLASTLNHIQKHENPDIVINLGDTGVVFWHKFTGFGLKDPNLTTPYDLDAYEKIFRLARRKIFSALTPQIPVYLVFGNHDGRSGFNRTRESAIKYDKKYWKQPANSSPDENYFWLAWGDAGTKFMPASSSTMPRKAGALFGIIDVLGCNPDVPRKPEDWTLGARQMKQLENMLKINADWTFILGHNVLGGWPAGSDEKKKDYAYGRGPLFTAKDYSSIGINPALVEQVALKDRMLENGVDGFIYGHDHISHSKEIELNSKGRMMRSFCVGSTKYMGEQEWYEGEFWNKFYGKYGRYGEPYRPNDKMPDFFGPPSYTKMTISKESAEVEYICSAKTQFTNIPDFIKIGDCMSKVIL